MAKPHNEDQYSDEETARRRDEVIRRMANTPPKLHKDVKLGKRKAKASTKPSPGVSQGKLSGTKK
jgi:hypothetical protein